ncbi:hypothetical protein [Jiulongibacter sp. NS-SX5]|uniref:hypothetical protein n=1 Tax=Jiulongibacter sp. NS-SX5 TaxID=3463854 RepID=UPI004059E976
MKNNLNFWAFALLFQFLTVSLLAQNPDSTKSISTFNGTIGVTNNGFSIIPTFSLNSPAAIMNFAFRKNKLSFEPDIRLVPDASKGGMLFWLRYRIIENKKFSFRVGAHPAFTLVHKNFLDNGQEVKGTEMLRFLAWEAVPNYQINKTFGIGAMYLQGHGLQENGPKKTDVLFLNTSISNIRLYKQMAFHLYPSVYFLNTDGFRGDYLTATGVLTHAKSPLSLQATINQTFKSNVPGNKDFMWNVTLNYSFSRKITKS